MDKPRIGLDLDGVVYDFIPAACTYYRIYRGYKGTDSEFAFYLDTRPKEEQKYIVSLPELYDVMIPTKSIMTFLYDLENLGEIFYITARPESVINTTLKYFRKYNWPFKENLIFCSGDKSVYIREHMISFYLDDQPKHVRQVSNFCMAFLLRRPWNSSDENLELPTLTSLEQYKDIIEESINGASRTNQVLLQSTGIEVS